MNPSPTFGATTTSITSLPIHEKRFANQFQDLHHMESNATFFKVEQPYPKEIAERLATFNKKDEDDVVALWCCDTCNGIRDVFPTVVSDDSEKKEEDKKTKKTPTPGGEYLKQLGLVCDFSNGLNPRQHASFMRPEYAGRYCDDPCLTVTFRHVAFVDSKQDSVHWVIINRLPKTLGFWTEGEYKTQLAEIIDNDRTTHYSWLANHLGFTKHFSTAAPFSEEEQKLFPLERMRGWLAFLWQHHWSKQFSTYQTPGPIIRDIVGRTYIRKSGVAARAQTLLYSAPPLINTATTFSTNNNSNSSSSSIVLPDEKNLEIELLWVNVDPQLTLAKHLWEMKDYDKGIKHFVKPYLSMIPPGKYLDFPKVGERIPANLLGRTGTFEIVTVQPFVWEPVGWVTVRYHDFKSTDSDVDQDEDEEKEGTVSTPIDMDERKDEANV